MNPHHITLESDSLLHPSQLDMPSLTSVNFTNPFVYKHDVTIVGSLLSFSPSYLDIGILNFYFLE